jgi:hypothetical protein
MADVGVRWRSSSCDPSPLPTLCNVNWSAFSQRDACHPLTFPIDQGGIERHDDVLGRRDWGRHTGVQHQRFRNGRKQHVSYEKALYDALRSLTGIYAQHIARF